MLESTFMIKVEATGNNSGNNFQATERAQRQRVQDAETPLNLADRLPWNRIDARVIAQYDAKKGGSITTIIEAGRARMWQVWDFDPRDNLVRVIVTRDLKTTGSEPAIVDDLTLVRDDNGSFQIEEGYSGFLWPLWETEFQRASRRMSSAYYNRHATPQLSQK